MKIPSGFSWWAQVDSNHRPRAYQARALTTWAMSPCKFFGVSRLSLHPFLLRFFVFRTYSHRRGSCSYFLTSKFGCRHCRLVEMMGIEPMTPCLQGRCSPSWATPPFSWGFLFMSEQSLKIEQQKIRTHYRAPISPSLFGFLLYFRICINRSSIDP